MNKAVFSVGKRIQAIVDKTMREYPLKNIHNEYVDAVEYSSEIPAERMLSDAEEMRAIFVECVGNSNYSFDDISAVFAMLCTCCARYGLDSALGGQFEVVSFIPYDENSKEHEFLSSFGKAIFGLVHPFGNKPADYFSNACELYPDNEIVNLYRFIGLVGLLYSDNGGLGIPSLLSAKYATSSEADIRIDMLSAYGKLSEPLKEYVIVDADESLRRTDNLPCVQYSSYSKSALNACLSDYQGISEGAQLKGDEGDTDRLLKVMTAIGNELISAGKQPTCLNLIFLFQRLHDLQELKAVEQKQIEDAGEDGQDTETPDVASDLGDEGDSADRLLPIMRESCLALPYAIEPSANDFHSLFVETLRADLRTAERDRAINEKSAVIRDFAHTYGNMKATGLYEIAQSLLKNEDAESKRMGRQVLLEYGIKQDLTKAVYMMRLRFEENAQELRHLLRDSIAENNEEGREYIGDVISAALQLSLLRVFYDASDRKAKLARMQLKTAKEKLNPLRDSFEAAVVFQGANAMDWMSDNVTPVDVSISAAWEQLAFRKESYATVFLRDIFAEVFFNVLKYADLKQSVSLNLLDNDEDLIIEIVNDVAKMDSTYSGVGLESKRAMLDVVNGRKAGDDKQSMTWGIIAGKFHAGILLDKSILKGE